MQVETKIPPFANCLAWATRSTIDAYEIGGARKLRKGRKQQTVELRRLVTWKDRPDRQAADGEPRVIEFPKPHAPEDVVSERIIFEVGSDRVAIKWTAEIERLPPTGPVAVEQKKGTQEAIKKQLGLKPKSKDTVRPVMI